MNQSMIRVVLLCLLSTLAFSRIWISNPDHSELFFKIDYLKLSATTGRFNSFSSELDLDKEKVQFIIKSNSIDTSNGIRDTHLKGVEFLNVKTYPLITFVSQKLIKTDGGYIAKGKLNLLGIAKDLAIPFQLTKEVKDTWQYPSRFATFKTEINRKDFGISWNKTLPDNNLILGDRIKIWGTIQLQPKGVKTPSSKHRIPDTPTARIREQANRGEINLPAKVISYQNQNNNNDDGNKMITDEVVYRGTGPHTHDHQQVAVEKDNSTLWWISYFILGMLGLGGMAIISFQLKFSLMKYWNNNYEEVSFKGFLTDFLVLFLAFLYSFAMWNIYPT